MSIGSEYTSSAFEKSNAPMEAIALSSLVTFITLSGSTNSALEFPSA